MKTLFFIFEVPLMRGKGTQLNIILSPKKKFRKEREREREREVERSRGDKQKTNKKKVINKNFIAHFLLCSNIESI